MLRRALLISLLFAVPALAKEFKGVKMADTITVDGKALKLNGMGLRTKVVFKVYVAGLYLEEVSNDPAVILTKDQTRKVEMIMLRDLEKAKIVEAIQAGFEKNNADKMPALKERLAKFVGVIPDLKENQILSLTYVPGKGTTVKGGASAETTVEGKDFADALFSVWLGKTPVDEDLKSGMLGK
ncbi:MAG: hypothetical protein H6Q89_3565 [Myxococcaceae bacterium]|nr:hypothetical protein [Myxococcaceae bacterium]